MSAAVYVYGSSSTSYPILKITDGAKITDNYNLAYNSNGLGVFVGNYRKVLMTGGEISGNSAVIKEGGTLQVNGGGVFVDDKGTFEMSGGKICDNALSVQESSVSCGGAVYLMSGGTFKMSGKSYNPYGESDGKNEIYISGTITGKQIIPKTTTGTNALNIKKDTTVKSILISGNSALSGGSPQDTINANVGDTAASGGSAITINTDVPITFKKINITGGNTTGNGGGLNISSSSNVTVDANVCIYANYANKGAGVSNAGELTVKDGRIYDNKIKVTNSYLGGGGIYSTSGSVTYISGEEISGNSVESDENFRYGGGVYNDGGSVFIYGSEVIGTSEKPNKAVTGAGVCNNGYLYIGYSSAKSDKTPDKTESGTPVIQYNSGLEGCGIYNKDNFFVYMRTGDISFNEGTGIGIGVYTSGTFTMSGGSITNNKNKSSNNNRGGGVYIY